MSEVASSIIYRRLRAPQRDGEALFDPPVADEAMFLRENIDLRKHSSCDLSGVAIDTLRGQARDDLIYHARRYTGTYRNLPDVPAGPDMPLILVGHQPELVHPGVWFKNFLLSRFARRTGSLAINLLIDNDSVRSTAVRVPSGSIEQPALASIPLDVMAPAVPYEARGIHDLELFSSFGERAASTIAPLISDPLVRRWWPTAVEAARRHGNLGQALAQARHRLEDTWGLDSLELPLSEVCDSWAFRWFTVHILRSAEQLRQIHNDCLAEYRQVNRIRSRTHPVPDLVQDGAWTEVPFWLWTVDEPHRRPAFVRRRGKQVELSDREDQRLLLDLSDDTDASRAVDQLQEAHRLGMRLRPRALITTMYARLILSDIFIHGIGGAKYDQVTDAMVRRFLGVEPPAYLVATATLRLPVASPSVDLQDIQHIKWLQREMRFHPELHVEASPETLPLIAEKQHWIQQPQAVNHRRERHEQIKRVNDTLYAMLSDRRAALQQEEVALRAMLRSHAILNSREYAFCLFPESSLRERLLDLSAQ